MSRLEQSIGVRLLNRTPRSVAPTQAGERLLARLRPALEELRSALGEVDELEGQATGRVRINAPEQGARLLLQLGGEARFIAVASRRYLGPQTFDDLQSHECIRCRLPNGKLLALRAFVDAIETARAS